MAEANRLRARRDWAEAESGCIEVLRADPNNIHAHSLLGDIYRDQRRIDEAAQWYQLAVDLDPSSIADRTKLKETEDDLARQLVRAVTPGSHNFGTQKLAGLTPAVWIKAMWALLAVFIVVSVILVITLKGRQNSGTSSTSTALRYGTIGGPGMPPGSASSARSTRFPFNLPQAGLPKPQPARALGASSPIQSPVQARSGAQSPAGISDQEVALLGFLTRQGGLNGDVTVSGLILDPRQDHVTVVMNERNAQQLAGESLRDAMVRSAFHAAFTLYNAGPVIQRVTINIRLGTNAVPIFSGDTERSSIQRVADTGDYALLLTVFSNVWWNPAIIGLAPQTPAPSAPIPAGEPGEGGPN